MPIIHTPYGESEPVELGEGRGDLRYSSVPMALWDGGGTFGDRPVSYARIFAEQPWVAIAVMRLLTWSVRVPLKVYRRVDEREKRRLGPADHPLAAAIRDPWERGSRADLVTSILGPLWVHGNGLTDVLSGAGDAIRFDPLDWRTIKPIRLDRDDPYSDVAGWEVWSHSGRVRDVRSSDTVLHLAWWSPLGRLGVSPLRQLRATITAEAAALDWNLTNLANAARPSGVVEVDDSWLGLERDERQTLLDQTRSDMREAFSGPAKAGLLPVLPPGLKWSTAEHTTAVEAQLIEQRRVNREEVAAVYQLPPPMIGILDRATYSNIHTAREMAYTDGLAPPLILTEQAINAHVCRGLLAEDDLLVEFDFAGILRGDRLREIQAIREAIATAALTPNEGRDVLNRPRYDHESADRLYLPRNNLRAIDEPVPERSR